MSHVATTGIMSLTRWSRFMALAPIAAFKFYGYSQVLFQVCKFSADTDHKDISCLKITLYTLESKVLPGVKDCFSHGIGPRFRGPNRFELELFRLLPVFTRSDFFPSLKQYTMAKNRSQLF
jgi:hypothetical protein